MGKLTVTELVSKLGLEILVEGDMTREVTGGYVGDLLSWIMGRAQDGDAWVTVMGNINSIAVASLADVACIILSENAALDAVAKAKAETEDINVFSSDLNAYHLAIKINAVLTEAGICG